MSSIKDQLANAHGRADEAPNIVLAESISKSKDKKAIQELIRLTMDKKAAVRSDAIKVLYEIGERENGLIQSYLPQFIDLLHHKDNRMKWGAMSALSSISKFRPEALSEYLPVILEAMDSGSVITRDHGIYILCNVSKLMKHRSDCFELLAEQIENAPVNQMPMYAEKMAEVINEDYKGKLVKLINARKDVMDIPSKKRRLDKLIRQLEQ